MSKHMPVEKKILPTPQELAEMIGSYEVLIMRVDPKIDRQILDRAEKLLAIGVGAVGLNHIDLEYAKEKGITVMNVPAVNFEAVAELTIGRMIDLFRFVPQANNDVKQKGIWDKYKYMGRELAGKTLGLVALGRIGSRVAEIARVFGMEIIAFDPFLSPEQARERGAQLVTMDELFRQADVISIHAPLTPETRNMVNKENLEKMKPGSFLLNMGRGELVDEDALYDALKSRQLTAAGADVMQNEPRTESPLFELDNFIITPHIGGQTEEAQYQIGTLLCERLLEALNLGGE